MDFRVKFHTFSQAYLSVNIQFNSTRTLLRLCAPIRLAGRIPAGKLDRRLFHCIMRLSLSHLPVELFNLYQIIPYSFIIPNTGTNVLLLFPVYTTSLVRSRSTAQVCSHSTILLSADQSNYLNKCDWITLKSPNIRGLLELINSGICIIQYGSVVVSLFCLAQCHHV